LNLREIGLPSGLGTDGLDPRVPNSMCLEFGKSFFTGLELGLEKGWRWLDFYVDFGITTTFLSKCFCLLPRYLSPIYRAPHATCCCVEQLHLMSRSLMLRELLWLLAPRILSDLDEILMSFWPFEHPFLD
jgi:hypothetical protein